MPSVLMVYSADHVKCGCGSFQVRLDDPQCHTKVDAHRAKHLEEK